MLEKNKIFERSDDRPIVYDHYIPAKPNNKLVIFCHGFKGFKDWGHFPYFCMELSNHGYEVYAINFSKNGTTVENPDVFADLEAFSENTFTQEKKDLQEFIEFAVKDSKNEHPGIFLVGHSRGGSIVLLVTAENKMVKGAVCWAAVADLKKRWEIYDVDTWRKVGVIYVPNSRTGQKMPVKFSAYEDCLKNEDKINVLDHAKKINVPVLLIHGGKDETVPLKEAISIDQSNPKIELMIFPDAGHTFGASHPAGEKVPDEFKQLTISTIEFFNKF